MTDTPRPTVEMRLHEVAHARTGDKGNRLNVSVIPYRAQAYPYILEQITEERVLALFAHRGATRVIRYELPKLPACNFVIDDVLEGGVNASLNLDGHGKTLSFLVLTLPIRVPRHLALHPPDADAVPERESGGFGASGRESRRGRQRPRPPQSLADQWRTS